MHGHFFTFLTHPILQLCKTENSLAKSFVMLQEKGFPLGLIWRINHPFFFFHHKAQLYLELNFCTVFFHARNFRTSEPQFKKNVPPQNFSRIFFANLYYLMRFVERKLFLIEFQHSLWVNWLTIWINSRSSGFESQ
jgi:hypothetical protein